MRHDRERRGHPGVAGAVTAGVAAAMVVVVVATVVVAAMGASGEAIRNC
jgi:hypothetical protein